jgi:iron complex outermembrane receptor protein
MVKMTKIVSFNTLYPQKTHKKIFSRFYNSFTKSLGDNILKHFKLLPLPLLLVTAVTVVHAEEMSLPTISVQGVSTEVVPYAMPALTASSPDTGDMIKRLPGANINRNGPITSIAQYRGLFGNRVNVLIDGFGQQEAGPNSMDSPLSYLAASRTKSVSVYRGIAPVRTGIETIGGTLSAESNHVDFGYTNEAEIKGNASAGYASNGHARQLGLTTAITNQNHRLQVSGSSDRGDDLDFKGGTIRPSKHDRDTLGLHYGYQDNGQTFNADIEHLDIGETATSTMPMDIVFFRGENYKFKFGNEMTNGDNYEVRLRYQDIEHEMNNFEQRDKPLMQQRFVTPDVEAFGISALYNHANLTFGFDIDQADHNATIFSPNDAAFFIEAFNDVERDRYSIFAEGQNEMHGWNIETGVRYSLIESDASEVTFDNIPAMAVANLSSLGDRLNNADRSQEDHLVDLVAVFKRELNQELDFEFGFARKTRAPSYQERYLWAPIEVTAGLGDGNSYIGNIDLDEEVSYQAELGFDWHTPRFAVSPRIFYHHINDYIQGVAADLTDGPLIGISSLAPFGGDPTPLQYSNVDAKLYGFDANWLAAISPEWQLDGTISYVRGKRRDTGDNLYRIAPLSARTMLSYVQSMWRVGFEAETIAKQNQVSAENEEEQTGGYALFNLSGQYQAAPDVVVTAGVNNIFNRGYADHLGGFNRAAGNDDIAVGERLPGLGRNGYININYTF